MWQNWLVGILGLWIILLPFLGVTMTTGMVWTLVITGALVALLGFTSGRHERRMHHERR